MKLLKLAALASLVAGVAGVVYFTFTREMRNVRIDPRPVVSILSRTEPAAVVERKTVSVTTARPAESPVTPPIADAMSRVTKKPFGLYVRPGDSPVSPERFRGYHAGVDFETTADEQDNDVIVDAICDGPLLLKKWASGYGGAVVQSCHIGAQDVTVVYGHVRLSSVGAAASQELKRGQRIGVLGKGYGDETDGEREHLHLGIHKGTAIDIKGYVQSKADLDQWLDIRAYLRK